MIHMPLNGEEMARNIQAGLKLPVGNRLFQHILNCVAYLKYNDMIRELQMTPTYKDNRFK